MSRSVRLATFLCFSYSGLLAFETLWIEAGRNGLRAAAFWAEIHPVRGGVPGSLLGAVIWFAIGWGLRRRRRWAWLAAVTMAGLLSIGAALVVLIVAWLNPRVQLASLALAHPGEASVILASMGCLCACAILLCTREARCWFLDPHQRGDSESRKQSVP